MAKHPAHPYLEVQTGFMFEKLRHYLQQRILLTDEQFAVIRSLSRERELRRGEFLQQAGEVPRFGAFVAAGCLRSYVIDERGREHIVQFAPEDWWISDLPNGLAGQPSPYFMDAIENSRLIVADFASYERILVAVPAFAETYREGLQANAAAKNRRIVETLSATAEERFRSFLDTYPNLAQRVPQHMIASYLGLTPETLSRVRRQWAKK